MSQKLLIHIPQSYKPEFEYVIEFIFKDVFNFNYELTVDNINYTQISLPDNGSIKIQDDFFSKHNNGYLTPEALPQDISFYKTSFSVETSIPVFYGKPEIKVLPNKKLSCEIDIISSIFFLLTRWEEVVITKRDKHNRFQAASSVLYPYKIHERPLVNEYIELLYNMLIHCGLSFKRKELKYEPILTHDIDHLKRKYNPTYILKQSWRNKSIKSLISLLPVNYYDFFDWTIKQYQKNGLNGYFFFMSENKNKIDSSYSVNDKLFKKTINKLIKNKQVIGFHPGYYTFKDKHEFNRQKQKLEKKINKKVLTGRQHFLRFSVPETWQIWNDAKMHIDFTAGYAETPGFRCGTTLPFHPFNVLTRKKLDIKEIPLLIMDTTVFHHNYSSLNKGEVMKVFEKFYASCKKYNIPFTMLFHNSMFDPSKVPYIHSFYKKIIEKYSS